MSDLPILIIGGAGKTGARVNALPRANGALQDASPVLRPTGAGDRAGHAGLCRLRQPNRCDRCLESMIMLQMLMVGLLWFSAIGCGLLAGLYFAFSTFIMTALGRIGQAAGIAAMNAINIAIVQSLFMPIFLATTAASAALAVIAAVALGRTRRDGDGGRRRALCARHVRRHGDLQRAPEQRACRGRSG